MNITKDGIICMFKGEDIGLRITCEHNEVAGLWYVNIEGQIEESIEIDYKMDGLRVNLIDGSSFDFVIDNGVAKIKNVNKVSDLFLGHNVEGYDNIPIAYIKYNDICSIAGFEELYEI